MNLGLNFRSNGIFWVYEREGSDVVNVNVGSVVYYIYKLKLFYRISDLYCVIII